MWRLLVQDNGLGMYSAELKNATNRFFRAESSDTPNTKGFGLGLSYVKTVVERMGGNIELESKPNKGTIVTIKIPSS